MHATVNGQKLELVQGDITQQSVDSLVNAANTRLAGGGGVDGAIHRQGGPAIMAETRRKYPNGCPTGSAVVSGAGRLNARFVFHAVGPIWRGGQNEEPKQLASAYRRCLQLAAKNGCESIAFPALSAGAYSYPLRQAAEVALGTTVDYLRQHARPHLVRFVLFDPATLAVFEEALSSVVESDELCRDS